MIKQNPAVLFGTVKRLSMNDELRIDLQGKPIKNVTSYKYLGVYLDRGLTFIEHINRLKMKIAKRLGALTRSRPLLTSYAIKVYTAMVLPVFVGSRACAANHYVIVEKCGYSCMSHRYKYN